MTIRDSHASLNNDSTTFTLPSGSLDIISDDGRCLFSISQNKDGSIDVRTSSVIKQGKKLLEERLWITPVAANLVTIRREEYK